MEDTIEYLGMSQEELAERCGVSEKVISEIIKGKAPITSEIAMKLDSVLGVPAHFWNNREQNYRDALARQTEKQLFQAQAA